MQCEFVPRAAVQLNRRLLIPFIDIYPVTDHYIRFCFDCELNLFWLSRDTPETKPGVGMDASAPSPNNIYCPPWSPFFGFAGVASAVSCFLC